MPINKKLLSGPVRRPQPKPLPKHSEAKLSKAYQAGIEAFKRGKMLGQFPKEYRPRVGDQTLHEYWAHGYKMAQTSAKKAA